MTVAGLLDQLSSRELTEWRAFFWLQANPQKKAQTPDQMRAVLGAMVKKGKRNG